MIDAIIIAFLANYVVFTLTYFNMYCNHAIVMDGMHKKVIADFELIKAEELIREDAVNLAREIDNLSKPEIAVKPIEIFEIGERIKEKQKSIVGFEKSAVVYCLVTTDCRLPAMDYLVKPKPPIPPPSQLMKG